MAKKKEQYSVPQEYYLSEQEQKEILKKSKFSFVVNQKYTERKIPIKSYHCFCTGEEIVSPNRIGTCLYCGNSYYKQVIETKEYWEQYRNAWKIQNSNEVEIESYKQYETSSKSTIYYVKPSSFESGILFIKAQIEITLIENKEPKTVVVPCEIVDIRPGDSQRAYRLSKKDTSLMTEIDKEKVINLNSQTIKHIEIVYKDANTMLDFLIKNPTFAKYTGIMDCYINNKTNLEQNSFFIAYLSLYTYECVELISKMGHYSLLNSILEKLQGKPNKEMISNMLSELAHFINKDATTGSSAFNFPKYIANYLRDTEQTVEKYLFWADVYSRENISCENFKKILECDSFRSTSVQWNLTRLYDILLFDYKLLDVLKYLDKQNQKKEDGHHDAVIVFLDYLNMCSSLQIEYDKFPTNLFEIHDNLAKICASKKYELENNKIRQVHDAVLHYVDKDVLENDNYIIQIPSSSQQIIEEAQLQHNCVASYIPRMANGNTLIFFIRKKSAPATPYVTAEYQNGRLVQIKHKYNMTVFENDILDFAKKFVNNVVSKSPRHNGDLKEMIRKAAS